MTDLFGSSLEGLAIDPYYKSSNLDPRVYAEILEKLAKINWTQFIPRVDPLQPLKEGIKSPDYDQGEKDCGNIRIPPDFFDGLDGGGVGYGGGYDNIFDGPLGWYLGHYLGPKIEEYLEPGWDPSVTDFLDVFSKIFDLMGRLGVHGAETGATVLSLLSNLINWLFGGDDDDEDDDDEEDEEGTSESETPKEGPTTQDRTAALRARLESLGNSSGPFNPDDLAATIRLIAILSKVRKP